MKCPNCGREMNDDAVFCIFCGQRMSGDPVHPGQKKRDKTPLIIGLGLAAILLIIGIACVLLLNPFSGKSGAASLENSAETPSEDVTAQTEEPQQTQPETVVPALPEGSRNIGTSQGDTVGLPLPDAQPEVLQAIHEKYRTFLSENETAQKYGLIDFMGNDIPELILQERQEDGTSCFHIYYMSDDTVQQLTMDEVTAASDVQLLSNHGTLMVRYAKGYIYYITVDKSLTASVKFVKTETMPEYTDSAVLVSASDSSLLDLYLLGSSETFSESGWIRMDGTDYYYASGKPLTHHWIEEDGIFYYLGDDACITQIADQSMISQVLNAYFASYQTAFNEKDSSLLMYATENNKAEEEKRFQLEENRYLTISDLTCESTFHKSNDSNGSIEVDVHLEYTKIGEWKAAEETFVKKDYRITLVWVDGQWFVDHIGNR